jgi:hypothetical protein
LTAWLGSSAKHNNRNKQNKLSNRSRRNIALFAFICPLNALNPFSKSKYTQEKKTPRKQAKTTNFSGFGFLVLFLLLQLHQSTRRDVKNCRQATSLLARSVLDS